MKKFTSFLIAGLMVFVASASAAVLQARVILNANTNYEVQIDGRMYNSNGTSTITDLATGNHTVAVYQVVSNGVFGIGKKRNLISSEQFTLGNNDVTIDVNQNGQARIYQNGYNGNNKNDRDRNGGYNQDSDRGEYGRSEGKGKGNKYGHYKGKKGKNKQKKSHDDDDHDDDNRSNRRGNN